MLREQGINSVFTQLSEQGIQVLSMRKANRLEELFVSLVNENKEIAHDASLLVALKASGRKRSIALCVSGCRRWCRQSSP